MTLYESAIPVLHLGEPDPPPYQPDPKVVLAAPQLDGSVVRLARSTAGVWRVDVIRQGREIYTRVGGRTAADVRTLVRCAQGAARDRGSEILVCAFCRLPLSAIKETTTLCRSTGTLAHVECPDLFGGEDLVTPRDLGPRR
jgi:hypothetical protein